MPSADDVGTSPPGSFAVDLGDWDDWLLVHGLPELPDVVGEGEAVPVAVWVGSEWAATLHLSYRDADEDEPSLDTDHQAFRRVRGEWEAANGSGGSNWSPGLALKPPSLGPRDAFACGLGLYVDPAWSVGVVDGVAGSDAATVEVETPAGIESAPLRARRRTTWV